MIKVLFVCHGNICRSPTAEGVFRKIVEENNSSEQFEIDSVGIIGSHEGEPPDPRTQTAAKHRGYDLSSIRSRPIDADDFKNFDYILAMDHSNVENLKEIVPDTDYLQKVQLFLEYSNRYKGQQVPDPYSGGALGFERVLDMIEDAAKGLFSALKR